ncbi:zinc-binding dehydrogenase [Candidatus Berkiella aquae]|uniref:NADP-dependent oxidoreductase n=1 Tax=Candidatus Berkiella aquae TaxID=295108 RepID=A0A0Q9YPP0_9GAMM|nr:NADP-dependent oxidoreductase [Candidatus Berkiella aquae]MCS5709926.1 NADP-dependent oxidoreductase [Candidatus Berkiella aquae]
MKIAQYHSFGNIDVVKLENINKPTIKGDEVLVAVHAASINPIDWKVREGHYADPKTDTFPKPMGWDFSGTVVEAGSQATPYKVGDEVFGLIRFPQPAGCFAEFVAAPANEIALKPASLDHEHAAGVPLVALTAWQALFATTHLKAGQKVLIHAAAGAVGQMAIQMAKYKGATVVATGSAATKAFCLSLGADEFIDYQTEKFEDKVNDVDITLDLIGKDVTIRSLKTMKPGGQLICFTQPIPSDAAKVASENNITAQFTIVSPNGEQLKQIAHLIDDQLLKTKIEKIFPLEQIKEALTLQQTGHCHGKIILKIKS